MTLNPFITTKSTPEPIGTDDRASASINSRDIGSTLAWFVLFPCVGGFIGFFGYVVTALILESSVIPNVDPPKYTYGQQSGLISLPLSTVIGFTAGFAIALFVIGRRHLATLAMFGVAILGSFVTYRLWYNDGIGECNSAIVLYYPVFGLCTIIAITGILIATVAMMFSRGSSRVAR